MHSSGLVVVHTGWTQQIPPKSGRVIWKRWLISYKRVGKNETSRGQRQKAQKTPTTKGGAERIRVVYSREDLEETSAETVEGLFQRRSAGKTLCIRKNLTRSSARQVLIKRKFQTVKVSYELEETAKGNSGNTLPWCFFGTVNKTA